jgi:hypothetical protein
MTIPYQLRKEVFTQSDSEGSLNPHGRADAALSISSDIHLSDLNSQLSSEEASNMMDLQNATRMLRERALLVSASTLLRRPGSPLGRWHLWLHPGLHWRVCAEPSRSCHQDLQLDSRRICGGSKPLTLPSFNHFVGCARSVLLRVSVESYRSVADNGGSKFHAFATMEIDRTDDTCVALLLLLVPASLPFVTVPPWQHSFVR